MIDLNLVIDKKTSIYESIDKLVNGGKKVVFILDNKNNLLGIFTNGDMRKVLLSDTDFTNPIESVMNKTPIVFSNKDDAFKFSKKRKLIVYPIVENRMLVDALFANDEIFKQDSNNILKNAPLVMMAGGKGTRLLPYTKILPKALIPIGDYTIAERIIQSFVKYGCNEVFFILNHKANMIKAYFNELKIDYKVHYAIESTFLGTGGGLSLIKDKVHDTFIVTNCDILVEDDLSCAYITHKQNKNIITMVCSSKNFQIPYGVIKSNEKGDILGIEEKPQFNYLINTGIYIVEPIALNLIEPGKALSMPELALKCKQKGMKVGIFPVSDKAWLDMGQFNTMDQMLAHFEYSNK